MFAVPGTGDGRRANPLVLRALDHRPQPPVAPPAQADLIAAIPDAIISTDECFRITSWNPAAERIYGWSAMEAIGCPVGELLWQDPGREYRVLSTFLADGSWVGETRHWRKDGSTVPVQASVRLLRDDDGDVAGSVAICADITERKAAEAARLAAEQRFATVVASLDEGILVIGEDERIQTVNQSAARILGVSVGDLEGTSLATARLDLTVLDEDGNVVPPHEWPGVVALRAGTMSEGMEVVLVRPDGDRRWLSVNCHPLGGAGVAAVLSFRDVTDEHRAAQDLEWAASHDRLTGLRSRQYLIDHLDRALVDADDLPVAVLFCDLDRFKEINDSLGHEAGDVALVEVARRLRTAIGPHCVLARHGGDEFVAVCTGMHRDAVTEAAERIVEVVTPSIVLDAAGTTHHVSVGASVGIAFGWRGDVSTDLIRDADVAMYSAKKRAGSTVAVFDTAMRTQAQRRLSTREDLRDAIEAGALQVHYQPICRTSDLAVKGFEALVRWDHPEHGWLAPDEFVPLAEESGLVSALGAWVLHTAAAQTAAWRAAGRRVYVSVNLSARQLSDPRLVATVEQALAETGLDPWALWLELTESALAEDADAAGEVLHRLRELGVRVAIDDFGTGYSSLARLATFDVSALKIDRSFVAAMTCGETDGAIVKAVVALAHELDLFVVAEGVERIEQLRALDALGCDSSQGFLLGRPALAGDAAFEVDAAVRQTFPQR